MLQLMLAELQICIKSVFLADRSTLAEFSMRMSEEQEQLLMRNESHRALVQHVDL